MPVAVPPFRLLLFGDPRSATSTKLVAATLDAVAERSDVDVVAIVDTATRRPARSATAKELAARIARRAFNRRRGLAVAVDRQPLGATTLRMLARRHRVALIAPRARGVNDPDFVEAVRALRPDGALALMVPKIFGAALLDACRLPVNYHNGLLPSYRGVAATEWSVYRGEPRSGFTFHRMTSGVDEGPILLQDAVSVPGRAYPSDIEHAKTRLARTRLPAALDLLVAGAPGTPQPDGGERHTRAETRALTTVVDPSRLTFDELERRVRAFEVVELEIAGARWPVTDLARAGRADSPLAFTTADGVRAAPRRIMHLPVPLGLRLRRLRGVRSRASGGAAQRTRSASSAPATDRPHG